jgi:chemotaxis protein methyltransferase CheR
MTATVSQELLSQFGELIGQRIGLEFSVHRRSDLERGVHRAARESGFADPDSYLRNMIADNWSQQQIETLAAWLTIGETYFFREKVLWERLGDRILPELVESRRDSKRLIRIWSAGCSTGEEAYSLAILLSRLFRQPDDATYSIMASDINPRALAIAERGAYSEWSFRGTPPWVCKQYFTPASDARYCVRPGIRNMVDWTHLNLAADVYPSLSNGTNAMDIILCRNVLMYFRKEQAQKVVSKLRSALSDRGWLLVGAAETFDELYAGFEPVRFDGLTAYRKRSAWDPITEWSPNRVRQVPTMTPNRPATLDPIAMTPSQSGSRSSSGERDDPLEPRMPLAAEEPLAESPPKSIPELIGMAKACADEGQLAAALTWCDQALSMDNMIAHTHYLRATILRELDLLDEAVRSVRQAIYLDKAFILAHFTLGSLLRSRGRERTARKHFETALVLLAACPDDAPITGSQGLTAARLSCAIQTLLQRSDRL